MASRDSFVFYRSFYEAIKGLDDETRLQVYDCLSCYSLDHKETELNSIGKAIFTLIKPQIDANFKKYVAGSKGGRPKVSQSSEELEDKDNLELTKAKPTQNQSITKVKPNVNENDNVNDNVNVKRYILGNYQHVKLTEEDLAKLYDQYGGDKTKRLINYLDEYIEMKGYKAKNHYLCIKKWVVDALDKEDHKFKQENKPIETLENYDDSNNPIPTKEQLDRLEERRMNQC